MECSLAHFSPSPTMCKNTMLCLLYSLSDKLTCGAAGPSEAGRTLTAVAGPLVDTETAVSTRSVSALAGSRAQCARVTCHVG